MGSLGKSFAFMFALTFAASLAVATSSTVKAASQTIVVPDDYPTIQAAVDHASAGDTVFVKKGTYYCGSANKVVIGKSLSLVGEDANTTIINGQIETNYPRPGDYSTVSIDASNVLITGFTITNCENAIAINQYSSSYRVSGIRILSNCNYSLVYDNNIWGEHPWE